MEEAHKKFIDIKENEFSEIFYNIPILLLLRGRRRPRGEEIIVERVILREMQCLSWDEGRYGIRYNADKGNGMKRVEICRRIFSERLAE